MTSRRIHIAMIWLTVLVATPVLVAEDWPAWRGPRNNGTSTETGLPAKWSQNENLKWRFTLPGPGPSTPVVTGDYIFLTAADGDDLVLLCLDTSGKLRWRQIVGAGDRDIRQGESNMAAPSPVTDGEHVWAFVGTGELACYDMQGNECWEFDVEDRYHSFNLYWGMATSPLLDGDRLYLQLLHTNAQTVVALDKRTGKEIWQHQRDTDARSESRHSYASPVIYRHEGEAFLLTHGADYLVAHDLDDGSEIWRSGGLQNSLMYNPLFRLVATPAVVPGLIIVPSAKNGPVVALNPHGANGNITGAPKHQVWKRDKNTPDVPSPVVHDGLVYLCRENGQLLCLDAKTGEEIYFERAHSKRHRGSPVYADGKLYLMGMDGTVTVVKAGRKFEVLAKNRMDERIAASMAIADGTLYLRTYEALYAIAEEQ